MKDPIKIAVITVSDRSFQGIRKDLSGPAVAEWAMEKGFDIAGSSLVPDEKDDISSEILKYSRMGVDCVLTTGGTGCAPRDVTPEATLSVVEKIVPGIAEVMRARSMEITPHAMLSRAVAGILKKTLVVNLPGSPKGAVENLEFIEPALNHAVELLKNSVKDCSAG